MADLNLFEVIFVISRAGPMEVIWGHAAEGLNEFVRRQRLLPGRLQLTLSLFDRDYESLYDGAEIGRIKPLRDKPYTAGGDNALLDAVGGTIQYVSKRTGRTPAGDKPSETLVVIITEGHDRASIDFTYKQISRIIRHQQEAHGWKFMLAAACEDPVGMATAFSIRPDEAFHFEPTEAGILKVLRDVDERVSSMRMGGHVMQPQWDGPGETVSPPP